MGKGEQCTAKGMNMKVSLVGAGAVAQHYHLPAIKYIHAPLTAIVETDQSILKKVATIWKPSIMHRNIDVISAENTDLCIVCTPPDTHLLITEQLLRKGVSVLVEKPLVLSMKEYYYLDKVEKASSATCFGGQVRRFFPNIVLLKYAIQSGVFGTLREIKIFEGWPFQWKTVSGYVANPADEGIITDTGAHIFDVLGYLLEHYVSVETIRECAVDRYPQTNNLHLKFVTIAGIEIDIRLSRDTRLANKICIVTDCCTIVTESGFSFEPLRVEGTKRINPLFLCEASNYRFNVQYTFVLQLKEVLEMLIRSVPENSRVHYSKLDKAIELFDLVRNCYRIVPKISWRVYDG